MIITDEDRREFIDPRALDLAAVPVEFRTEAVLDMINDLDFYLMKHLPGWPEADLIKVRLRWSFEIVKRAVEISRGCSGAVGNA